MKPDLAAALSLLSMVSKLSDEEANELLCELELAELNPKASPVLFPSPGTELLNLPVQTGRSFVVSHRTYDCTFVYLVRETSAGNRRIVLWAPLKNPS
jgi:hypothetical protein